MWYDNNIRSYGLLNYIINALYCRKYNIDIIKCNKRRVPNIEPNWERIPLLLEHINKYDYVMWIDADAHFYVNGPSIIKLIEIYKDKNFIFSRDVNTSSTFINSGVFIVKNNEYCKVFLQDWINRNNIPDNYNFLDQGKLQTMYDINHKKIKSNSIVIPFGILQNFGLRYKQKSLSYIIHLAGTSTRVRFIHSLAYLSIIMKEL